MAFELDHLFICTDIDAPKAARLVSLGLTEGTSNVHPGQGTANRRFFFFNCMLELLWVHEPEEAQSAITRPTRLWERWRDRNKGACPFGFSLRSTSHSLDNLPFITWNYHPFYLPDSLDISIGTNSDILTEPMVFYIPFGKRPDAYPVARIQPLSHAIGFNEITRVTFVSPHAGHLSSVLQALNKTQMINIQQGESYRVELGFDDEIQGRQADLQPELPLILCW